MEDLICIQTWLIAGMIEVFYLNFIVGQKDIAVLVGGEGVAYLSNLISTLILTVAIITCSITIHWWYFLFTIVLAVLVGVSNIIVYPMFKIFASLYWDAFGPSRIVISKDYDTNHGQIVGCRMIALFYSVFGGGYLIYTLFF